MKKDNSSALTKSSITTKKILKIEPRIFVKKDEIQNVSIKIDSKIITKREVLQGEAVSSFTKLLINPDFVITKKIFNNNYLLVEEDKFIRHDQVIPYLTYIFYPPSNIKESNNIKAYLDEEYKKRGYFGFDYDYDLQYDKYSIYFLAKEKNTDEILVTARCTFRTANNKIPFEEGIRLNSDSNYILTNVNKKIMDINSFIYREPRILNDFIRRIASFLSKNDVDKIYCLLDSTSKRYKNIYEKSGYIISKEFCDLIYFPTFVDKNANPVKWYIMEQTKETYKKIWQV